MAVRRLRPGRGAGCGHDDADHHGKAQRGRPAGLAGRRAGSPAGSPRPADRRTPALDLGSSPADPECCLTSRPRNDPSRGTHRLLTALGRRAWLFAGSDRGAARAAAMATLITTAKLNAVDPQAWLADVLARLPAHPARRIDELLPWTWAPPQQTQSAA